MSQVVDFGYKTKIVNLNIHMNCNISEPFHLYVVTFYNTNLRIIKNSLYIFCDVCVNLVKCPWSITNTKTLKQAEED